MREIEIAFTTQVQVSESSNIEQLIKLNTPEGFELLWWKFTDTDK